MLQTQLSTNLKNKCHFGKLGLSPQITSCASKVSISFVIVLTWWCWAEHCTGAHSYARCSWERTGLRFYWGSISVSMLRFGLGLCVLNMTNILWTMAPLARREKRRLYFALLSWIFQKRIYILPSCTPVWEGQGTQLRKILTATLSKYITRSEPRHTRTSAFRKVRK